MNHFKLVAQGSSVNNSNMMTTETPDARHFRLAMQSFIGKDKIHNQTTLSVTSGVSRSLINEIIHGKRFAGRMAQEKIARACGLSLADFLVLGQKIDGADAGRPPAPGLFEDDDFDAASLFGRLPQNFGGATASSRRFLSKHPIPMLGLVECDMTGWYNAMDIAVSSSVLSLGPKSFAVMAEGESMRPEGISRGMLCYCDPDEEPLKGDAVYVGATGPGGLAVGTIKVFWGWGLGAGAQGEGWLKLRGWRKMDKFERQTDYFIEVPAANITVLATVVLVRRRL